MDVTYSFILGLVQGVQAVVDPVVSLYVPAVQDVQVDPGVALYDPAAHTEHESVEPDPVCPYPALHVHEVDPDDDVEFAGQELQEVDALTAEYVPELQELQEPDPVVDLDVPAAHAEHESDEPDPV
jgi:hypothetical protein